MIRGSKIFFLALLLQGAISCSSPRVEGYLEPPFSRFTGALGREYFVALTDRAQLGDTLDLSPFGPLLPGTTLEEASALLGPPIEVEKPYSGLTYYHFEAVGNARIQVVESIVQSDDHQGTRWHLRTEIIGRQTQETAAYLLNHLPGDLSKIEVYVQDSRSGSVALTIQNQRVVSLLWVTGSSISS